VIRPWLRAAAGLVLLFAVAWSLRWAARVRGGAELEPDHLVLRPGEQREVRLVNNEGELVAISFRVRFDESVVEVDLGPEPPPLAPGGEAIYLPMRREQGLVAVPGIALTGERTFEPGTTLYRFKVRGRQPGTTALAVEELTVVDLGDRQRALPVPPARVTVRAP